MRRVRDLRIQVAQLITARNLSRSKISRRGLARALLPSIVPELPIRSSIFAPGGCLSQVAGAVTGSLVNTNILLAVADSFIRSKFRGFCFDAPSQYQADFLDRYSPLVRKRKSQDFVIRLVTYLFWKWIFIYWI